MRELKITGLRTPGYNRRADLVCFVNGLPLVFIELKAVYKNIRAGFDGNLRDYMDENVIAHAFHHNAFLIVSNGHRARYGSITSQWEHFAEWKRMDETRQGQRGRRGAAQRHARPGPAARHRRELHPVRRQQARRDPQGRSRATTRCSASTTRWRRSQRQEELKREFPPEKRLAYRVVELPTEEAVDADLLPVARGHRGPK